MNKVAKGLLVFSFMSIILCKTIFSYSTSSYYNFTSSNSYGYSEVRDYVRFNRLMDLTNVNVKFTQNSSNYIFKVTAEANLDASSVYAGYGSDGFAGSVTPMLYCLEEFGNGLMVTESGKMKFADYISGNIYMTERVGYSSQSIYYFNTSYRQISKDKITDVVNTCTNNGGSFYLPTTLRNALSSQSYNYINTRNYPSTYTSNGASIVNSSYSYQAGSTQYFVLNATITINKYYMDAYRYVCFGQEYARHRDVTVSNNEREIEGISVCTGTIDLKEYANCDHNWVAEVIDKEHHRFYCDKCELESVESHDLMYEYDGISNNVCTCSYIDKVKYYFEINDDVINDAVEVCDSYCDYVKHSFTNKTGYKFKWYEKYKKQIIDYNNLSTVSNALREVFVATCSELDIVASSSSIIYRAKTEPIKYFIHYSNDNNKNIKLDGQIDSQVIDYDSKVKLNDNIYYKGYLFDGWSLDKDKKLVDFIANEEILNLTTDDMKEFTLYPIYKDLNFKIKYDAGNGKFSDGSTSKTIAYNYFDDGKLETPIGNEIDSYFRYYVDKDDNKFTTIEGVKAYIESKGIADYQLDLTTVFGKPDYGRPEKSLDGDVSPDGNGVNKGDGSGIGADQGTYETMDANGLINETLLDTELKVGNKYAYNKYGKDAKNKIYGMTNTTMDNNISTISYIGISDKMSSYMEQDGLSARLKSLIVLLMSKLEYVVALIVFLIIFVLYEVFTIKQYVRYHDEKNATKHKDFIENDASV